jgi:tetratricopeptide (TPR) repeat protein
LALSPTDTDIISDAAILLQSLGRLEEAIALKDYAVARDPVNPRGHHNLGNAYCWTGRWDEVIASYSTALSLSPGYIGEQTGIGQPLLGKGEPQAAFDWLNRAVEYNDPGLAEVAVENTFSRIQDDPCWPRFLESIGKSPEQQAGIEFRVTLPE